MSVEWALSIVDTVFEEKGDIRNCSCNRAWNEGDGNGVIKKVL